MDLHGSTHLFLPLAHGFLTESQVIFELNAIPTSTSSCRLRAGETEVLVALKCHVAGAAWREELNSSQVRLKSRG